MVGAVYFVLVAVEARPIADDWWFIGNAQRWGFGQYMNFNLGSSGRFSQFALAWLSARLFGSAAVTVTPLALLALAVAFTARAAHVLARRDGTGPGWVGCTALALLAVVSVVATTPGVYDTVGWFAAVASYLGAPVAAVAVAAWLAGEATRQRRSPLPGLVGVAVVAAIAGGFHEIVGASLTLAGLLGLYTVSDLCRRGVMSDRLRVPVAAVTLGAAIGTAANVFGPGAQGRASSQGAHISLVAAVRTALHNLSFLRADIHDGVLLLAVATGIFAWQQFGSVDNRWLQRWSGVWALFLLVVPWVITAALTAWAGSTESGDRSPFRAAFLATGSVAVGIALLVLVGLSRFPALLTQTRATMLAVLLVLIGTVGISHKAGSLITAERMRARAVSARAISVKRQLAEGRRTIGIAPAPLLTAFTQVYDLSFAPLQAQRGGWVQSVESYYGIPDTDRIVIEATQPRDYCLPDVAAPWVGVRSCQQLDARRPGVR